MSRVLILGSEGQIGTHLSKALSNQDDFDLFLSDIKEKPQTNFNYFKVNALSYDDLKSFIIDKKINEVHHLAAILSAKGEKDPMLTWNLNMNSLFNVMKLAREGIIEKVFWPSSIAVFGNNNPKNDTPQFSDKEPITSYGISKLAGENWCKYFNITYGTDIRSIRFPGVISYDSLPGGGTTDYAVDIFHSFKSKKKYTCFLDKDTILPMIYIDDAIDGIIKLMRAPKKKLRIQSSYNLSAFSMSPKMIEEELKKIDKEFQVDYVPDYRQAIADSWPNTIDDIYACKDWGWNSKYNFKETINHMLSKLAIL